MDITVSGTLNLVDQTARDLAKEAKEIAEAKSPGGLRIISLSAAEYDKLKSKDARTLYVVS